MPNIEWQENVTASTSGDPVMNSDDDMTTVYLYNSTHLRVQRYASDDGDLRIGWQVLECFDVITLFGNKIYRLKLVFPYCPYWRVS